VDEAKTRVVLDTSPAKAQLESLVQTAKDTAHTMRGVYRSTVGRGLNAIGLGGAFGAGMAAIKGATQSSAGDVFSEALGPLGNQVSHILFGDQGEDARAARSAREQAIATFGAAAGAQHWNSVPAGVRNWYESIKSLRLQEEKGRTLFEADPKFHGPGIGEVIDRMVKGIGTLLFQAVDHLVTKLNPFSGAK
jgi:hypothetical protein